MPVGGEVGWFCRRQRRRRRLPSAHDPDSGDRGWTGRPRFGGRAAASRGEVRGPRAVRRGGRLVAGALRQAAAELQPLVLEAAARALPARHRHLPHARRGRPLPRGLCEPPRDRRALRHARGAHRSRRRGLVRADVRRRRRGRAGHRRRGLLACAVHPGLAGSRALRTDAPARRRVPQSRRLPPPRRAGRRRRLLGHGDRLRHRGGWRRAGSDGGAHGAEHARALADGSGHRPHAHAPTGS